MSNIDKQALRVPERKRHDWNQAVMRDCDFCSQWSLTIHHEDGGCICANCCDAEYASELKSSLESAIERAEAAERELDNWRTSFNNERFRADKLAEAFKTEHEQLVMANGALITQHIRANRAESSIVLLEAEKSALRRALNNLAAVARRYLPDYDEHPDIQAADDLLESAAGIGKGE